MEPRDFEEMVDRMSRTHNPPPPTPRDRMWERIEAARGPRRQVLRPALGRRPAAAGRWLGAAAALAAVLAVGIFIGRLQPAARGPVDQGPMVQGPMVQGPQLPDPVDPAPAAGRDAGRAVARQAALALFDRADVLLTEFRLEGCDDPATDPVPGWASGLLLQTRLLLGGGGNDPRQRELLEELELVLAQIAGISNEHCRRDVAWIRDGLARRATVERLRLMTAEKSPLGQV